MDPARHSNAGALETAVVLDVTEEVCRVVRRGAMITADYAPQLPTPHVERVSPGHLVALATASDGRRVVMWRWYDAVVTGFENDRVRLWEPAHGGVIAAARPAARGLELGTRAYASAGLPGADWWVASPVSVAEVELDEVADLYAEYGLWDAALGSP